MSRSRGLRDMKGLTAIVGALLALFMLPMVAIGAITGAAAPKSPADGACVDPTMVMSGTWRPPLMSAYVVTSEFGMRYHPVLHTTKLHTGTDLVARGDKTVVSAADGKVVTSGFNTAYGNQVVLDNGGGIQTRYAHMASPSTVKVGQKLGAGTPLGTQGATGYVTGAHLHFEVIKNGKPIDPKPFMATQGAPLNGSATGGTRAASSPAAVAAVAKSPTGSTGPVTATRTDGKKFTANAEQLSIAATIIRVATETGAGDRGSVIALMTALQESELRNLDYGDRDSLGSFQQRPAWGTAQERQTPEYAARAFFGGPKGPNQGNPPGLLDKAGWKTMGLGEAAQAVQVSQFPSAYDKWEPVARAILSHGGGAGTTGCGASGSGFGELNVATWNICLEFCGGGKLRPWPQRVPLIATAIKTAHPDVISLQETGKEKSQGAAIINALAPDYKLAVYHRSKMVLFDPKKLSTEDAAGKKLEQAAFTIEGKGGVAQALRDRRTGQIVVVSSLHPVDGNEDGRRLRYVSQAHDIIEAIAKKQPGSTIVYAGDLNSFIPGSGNKTAVAKFFVERGFRSSEQIAETRTGQEYRSYNGGKPPRRGPRIDHVLVDPHAVAVKKWQQILSTTRTDPESDHNMVMATLTFLNPPVATQGAV
jgi:endonuclease/exonuclease/phosphatase family metal-dependent hydrolase